MSGTKPHRSEFGQEHLGVWDPSGGEARKGSGLPVQEGVEEVHLLARSAEGGGVREILPQELASLVADPSWALSIDILRPRTEARTLLQKRWIRSQERMG